MESQRFDQFVSSLAETGNRRRVLGVLAASVGVGTLSLLRPEAAEGAEYCLNGQTVTANKKKKKKLKKQGAIQGACPVSPPPPPTPNKSLRQDCTPGVDICPTDLVCAKPTEWHTCSSTVAGHANWCCAPEGKFCKDNCDCCQDDPNAAGEWFCDFVNGMTGFCKYQP
jgi:hypothetical protein